MIIFIPLQPKTEKMKRIKRILKLFSVLLLIWYYGSIHFFMHIHEVNGVKIMHSHIGGRHHDHTSLEYQLFKSLGESFICDNSLPFFLVVLAAITLLSCLGVVCRQRQPQLTHYSLRAPPAIC